MTFETVIGLRTSAAVHVSVLLAGLALASSLMPMHVHVQRGQVVLEASLASAEASAVAPAVLTEPLPQPREEATEPQPTELAPAAARIQPVSFELAPIASELVKLPQELEECECDAPEHALQTPRRISLEPPPPSPAPPTARPLPRTRPVADFSASAEVSLPSTASVEGSEVDEPPTKLASNPPPPYPPDAFQRGQQGRVVLQVHINAQGMVDDLRVLESSGVPSLDQSALDTVARWRFSPARRAGLPVATVVNVPVRFTIRS